MIISKDDYDKYEFSLCELRKQNKNLKLSNAIYKQLERVHPCFSDNCCFETQFFLRDKKIFVRVFVINRIKLAEYKSENTGRRLCVLEQNCKIKKTVFREQNNKRIIAKSSLLFACICVITIALFEYQNLYADKSNLVIDQRFKNLDVDIERKQEMTIFEVVTQLLGEMPESFEVFNFNYIFFNNEEVLTLDLKKLFPENIENLLVESSKRNSFDFSISEIIYENKKPRFTLTIKKSCNDNYKNNENFLNQNFNSEHVRTILIKNNGLLKKETMNTFNFEIPVKSFSNLIVELAKETNLLINGINFSLVNDLYDVNLVFEKNYLSTNKLISVLPLLVQSKIQTVTKKTVDYQEGMLIGKVNKNNNLIVKYFKMDDGRIVSKTFEDKKEDF